MLDEREEQMCKKRSLAPEATACLPKSVTSKNPLVSPGRAYWEPFFSQIKNLGRAEGINVGTWSARWNAFLVMWIYLAQSIWWWIQWEVSPGATLGRWLDEILSEQTSHIWIFYPVVTTGGSLFSASGFIKSNENITFSRFFTLFTGECTQILSIWRTETEPLLMDPIMYWFQISCSARPTDRWGAYAA